MPEKVKRLPKWLKTKIHTGKGYNNVINLLKQTGLNTICMEARCPNKGECFSRKEITFIIGGKSCTRNCLYCNVETVRKKPEPVNPEEAGKIAAAIKHLQLKYAVITSVTRDDLLDYGASLFVNTVREIKNIYKEVNIELLIPDLKGDLNALNEICKTDTCIIGHNIEVAGTKNFSKLRPMGNYKTSLSILNEISKKKEYAKSGFMLGFGETFDDIKTTLKHLYDNGVKIVTAGQYLAPSKKHYPVKKYYTPDEFTEIENLAYDMGFTFAKAGPFVRSSYLAGVDYEKFG